jgi:hypothetical protein
LKRIRWQGRLYDCSPCFLTDLGGLPSKMDPAHHGALITSPLQVVTWRALETFDSYQRSQTLMTSVSELREEDPKNCHAVAQLSATSILNVPSLVGAAVY